MWREDKNYWVGVRARGGVELEMPGVDFERIGMENEDGSRVGDAVLAGEKGDAQRDKAQRGQRGGGVIRRIGPDSCAR